MFGDPMRIEETAILRWMERFGPEGEDEQDEFLTVVARIDDFWLAKIGEKREPPASTPD